MNQIIVRDVEGRYRIQLIYEDEAILVVDKPAGLLTIPDHWNKEKACLSVILQKYLEKNGSNQKLFVVHRLDKETSGLVLFAKNAAAHKILNQAFEQHLIKKTYLALLSGVLLQDSGTIDAPISRKMIKGGRKYIDPKKGLPSITEFKVLERFRQFTLVEAKPLTGRLHQIRLHFASISHPLVIDSKYNKAGLEFLSIKDMKPAARVNPDENIRPILSRLPLHAYRLEFRHPLTDQNMEFKADLPKDFKSALNLLKKWGT
ncbi:MAG: RluA family pseudouridine synthase [Calditrichia bacterium]